MMNGGESLVKVSVKAINTHLMVICCYINLTVPGGYNCLFIVLTHADVWSLLDYIPCNLSGSGWILNMQYVVL